MEREEREGKDRGRERGKEREREGEREGVKCRRAHDVRPEREIQ